MSQRIRKLIIYLIPKILFGILLFIYIFTSSSNAIVQLNQEESSPNYLILLVHGIISNKEAFESQNGLKKFLENDLGLEGYVYSYDFLDNRGSNILAAHQLGDPSNKYYWIGQAKSDFKKWYAKEYLGGEGHSESIPAEAIPEKVILICHSMGGLAARKYITSDYYQNDVFRIITLDTPHLGSDAIPYLKRFWGLENLGKATLTTNVDDFLKGQVNKIKDKISANLREKTKKSFLSNLGFILNIPTLNDIYKDSADWVIAYESPNINGGIAEIGDKKRIIPGYLSVLLELVKYFIFSGEGYDQLDPDGEFINTLKKADIKSGNDHISFRVVSALGAPTFHKDLVNRYYLSTPYMNQQLIHFFPEYNNLTSETEKYWGFLFSTLLPGSMCLKDGSIAVAKDSSKGEGIELFRKYNTKSYDFFFHSKPFDTTMDIVEGTYYACIAAYTASSMFGVGTANDKIFMIPTMQLTFFAISSACLDFFMEDLNDSVLKAHFVIPTAVTLRKDGKPSIIEQTLDDIPCLGGILTPSSTIKKTISAQSLSTPTASFNDYDQPFVLLSNL
ncbi:esterase/lipase family protein, partial [Candidatus Margulisiibacteriota bacterium]